MLNGREHQVPNGGDSARLQVRVGRRDVGIDPRAGGRHCVDRNVVDRQSRVVWPFGLHHGRGFLADLLREVRVGRAQVVEGRAAGVVRRRRGRRPLVEVARARERLRGEARAHDRPLALDQAAVGLAGEGDLGEAGEERRERKPEHERQHDDRDHRRLELAHQWASPSTIGPSVSAGKTIRPAVDNSTPGRTPPTVPPSVQTAPAEAGTVFWAASEPPIARAASSGTNRPRYIATAPTSAEKLVAPYPAKALPLLFVCDVYA